MKMNKLAVARFSHGGRARMWADAKSQSSLLSLCTYTQSNNSSIMWPLGICHTCWVFFPSPNLKPNYHIAADCFPVNMKYKNKTTHLLKGNAQTVLQKCWQVEKRMQRAHITEGNTNAGNQSGKQTHIPQITKDQKHSNGVKKTNTECTRTSTCTAFELVQGQISPLKHMAGVGTDLKYILIQKIITITFDFLI